MKKFISLVISFYMMSFTAQADIRVDIIDGNGTNSSFSSNGKMVRMDNQQQPGYGLIDLTRKQFKMVDTANRKVIDLSGIQSQISSSQSVNSMPVTINLQNTGPGPKIAGYSTNRFQIFVNGKNCGTVFGSKEAMKEQGMQSLFDAMKQLEQQSNQMSGAFRSIRSDCEKADFQTSNTYKQVGAPMRIVDENGQKESEVRKINTNATTPNGFYDTPKDFRVTSMQGKMNQAMQQNQQMMRQHQNNMPDMNQMIQQMQQGGGLPPEAMDRIKQMQEMFKQQYPRQ